MSEDHAVYPGGPPCNPNCPGPWSMYHDGYADGYENGENVARASAGAGLDVERLAEALHEASPETHFRRKCSERHDIRALNIAIAYNRLVGADSPFVSNQLPDAAHIERAQSLRSALAEGSKTEQPARFGDEPDDWSTVR